MHRQYMCAAVYNAAAADKMKMPEWKANMYNIENAQGGKKGWGIMAMIRRFDGVCVQSPVYTFDKGHDI